MAYRDRSGARPSTSPDPLVEFALAHVSLRALVLR